MIETIRLVFQPTSCYSNSRFYASNVSRALHKECLLNSISHSNDIVHYWRHVACVQVHPSVTSYQSYQYCVAGPDHNDYVNDRSALQSRSSGEQCSQCTIIPERSIRVSGRLYEH
ncbi:hypothetical protein M8J77_021280 [Diaphorina citri]|nr:hypothetical protein M8J77_021280 [Diaphorina citri]